MEINSVSFVWKLMHCFTALVKIYWHKFITKRKKERLVKIVKLYFHVNHFKELLHHEKKSNLLGNHHKKSCDLGRFISGLIFVGLFPVCFHCIDWMMWQKDSNKGACKLERYDVSVYQSDFHFKRGCWEKSSALSITIFVPIYKSNWLINKINSRIYKHKHFTNIKLLKWYRADRFRWQRHKCFQRWSITSSFIHRQQFFTNTWYYLLHSYTLAR